MEAGLGVMQKVIKLPSKGLRRSLKVKITALSPRAEAWREALVSGELMLT